MKIKITLILAILVTLTFNHAMSQYCAAVYSTGCTDGDGVALFQLGAINQTIACDGSPIAYYHDYTASSTQLQVEQPATLTVQAGYDYTYMTVWIDFNNDNTFDASEIVVDNLYCGITATNYTATITVPAGTPDGNHRLRIRTNFDATINDPCASTTYGSYADFTVNTYTYCQPAYSTGCTSGDGLILFQLGTINQTIACDGSPYAYYHDYTASSTQLVGGVPATLTVQAGYSSTNVSVWIDFNDNFIFEPFEMVVNGLACVTASTNYTATITIPTGSSPGNHRMRYRTEWLTAPTDPCAAGTYGNYADFTVNTSYCMPSYSTGCTFGDGLTLFQVAAINQTIACDGVPNLWYHDYTTASTLMHTGVPYTLAFVPGYNSTYVSVWIDLNDNLTFEPSELMVNSFYCAAAGTTYNTTIALPVGTADGNHRMRYVTNWNSPIVDVCSSYGYGNCADFTVITTNLPDDAGTISGPTSVCPGTTGIVYSIPAIANATGYDWTVPTGATITSGSNTNSITVDFALTASSGNIIVDGFNTYGTGISSSLYVTISPTPIPNMYPPLISSESFENGGSVPSDWAIETISGGNSISFVTSTSWPSGYTAYDGSYLVQFNSFSVAGGVMRLEKTVPVSTVGLTDASVNFAWLESTGYPDADDQVEVEWSTDGSTWTTAGTFLRYNAVQAWTSQSQPLPAGALGQATLYIAFKFTSAYGNDCYLDLAQVMTPLAPVCTGNTVTYSTEPGMTGYSWAVSPGGSVTSGSGTSSISVLWSTAGAQTVSVNYANTNGCFATNSTVQNVTVNPQPVPTITGTNSVCEGVTGITYSTEPGMTGYTWSVSAGGAITAGDLTNTITVSWISAGAQTVNVNYTNVYGCTATGPVTYYNVTVNPIPNAAVVTQTNDTLHSSAATGNQWYSLAGGLIAGATNSYYVPTVNGTYWVIITLNGCSSNESNHFVVLNVSVSEYTKQTEISVYPNPANDVIYVDQPQAGEATIKLLDISGKLIFGSNIYDKENKINIENLSAGIYSLQYYNGSTSLTVKIVKIK